MYEKSLKVAKWVYAELPVAAQTKNLLMSASIPPRKPAFFSIKFDTLDDFRILNVISSSKFGRVLFCLHVRSRKLCVLKERVAAEAAATGGALREAEVLLELGPHEFIVPLMGYCRFGSVGLIALEHLQHGDLLTQHQRYHMCGISFDEQIVWHLLHNIGSALSYIHKKGFIFRDVKLANILLREVDFLNNRSVCADIVEPSGAIRKGNIQFLLTDFGICRKLPKKSSDGHAAYGNPHRHRADRYSEDSSDTSSTDDGIVGTFQRSSPRAALSTASTASRSRSPSVFQLSVREPSTCRTARPFSAVYKPSDQARIHRIERSQREYDQARAISPTIASITNRMQIDDAFSEIVQPVLSSNGLARRGTSSRQNASADTSAYTSCRRPPRVQSSRIIPSAVVPQYIQSGSSASVYRVLRDDIPTSGAGQINAVPADKSQRPDSALSPRSIISDIYSKSLMETYSVSARTSDQSQVTEIRLGRSPTSFAATITGRVRSPARMNRLDHQQHSFLQDFVDYDNSGLTDDEVAAQKKQAFLHSKRGPGASVADLRPHTFLLNNPDAVAQHIKRASPPHRISSMRPASMHSTRSGQREDKYHMTVLGTPNYMPSEMGEGTYSRSVDIYALGCCALELLTLRRIHELNFADIGLLEISADLKELLLHMTGSERLRPSAGEVLEAACNAIRSHYSKMLTNNVTENPGDLVYDRGCRTIAGFDQPIYRDMERIDRMNFQRSPYATADAADIGLTVNIGRNAFEASPDRNSSPHRQLHDDDQIPYKELRRASRPESPSKSISESVVSYGIKISPLRSTTPRSVSPTRTVYRGVEQDVQLIEFPARTGGADPIPELNLRIPRYIEGLKKPDIYQPVTVVADRRDLDDVALQIAGYARDNVLSGFGLKAQLQRVKRARELSQNTHVEPLTLIDRAIPGTRSGFKVETQKMHLPPSTQERNLGGRDFMRPQAAHHQARVRILRPQFADVLSAIDKK